MMDDMELCLLSNFRCLASSAKPPSDSHSKQETGPTVITPVDSPSKEGWLRRLLPVRNIDPGHQSHSQQLSDKESVYELQSM